MDEFSILPIKTSDIKLIPMLTQEWMNPDVFYLTVFSCKGYTRFLEKTLDFQASLSSVKLMGVYDNNTLIAFSEWRIFENVIFLNNLYVSPLYRNKGVGYQLLKYGRCLATSLDIKQISLDVFEWNQSSYSWYKKLGFSNGEYTRWFTGNIIFHEDYSTSDIQNAEIIELSQAKISHQKFGFSSFKVITSRKEYSIGRLGDKHFRLTDVEGLNDKSLLKILFNIDSNRKIFLVTQE
ncbi:GNAT family N-acetyltransferase, partial [Paenibacillus helianthi]|uniref:GNAT family N-acetyltransferase n=1 Tax=Paenibacillus helianthi TaxID=1349432 RepID=UPI000A5710F3